MPNWCQNYLEFKCSKELYNRYKMDNFQFSNILKCPDELIECSSPNRDNPEEMIGKYGYANWYDWVIANWGVKWDIEPIIPSLDDSKQNEVSGSFAFDTAWSPPIELYRAMESLGFSIDAMYYEGGMAFYGFYNDGGQDTCSFSNQSEIPENVAMTFGIEEIA